MMPLRLAFLVLSLLAGQLSAQCPPGAKNCPYPSSPATNPSRPAPPYNFRAASGNTAPWATVVRISTRLTDKTQDVGSGTIVDGSADSALVMTAAHVVAHGSPVTVEIFGPNCDLRTGGVGPPIASFVGEVLDRDPASDVGLVRFRPGRQLAASPLAPAGRPPGPGTPLVSLGCSQGKDPTAVPERFVKRQDYMATTGRYRAIECERAPLQGRSGGGLFDEAGHLHGVCDFAEQRPPGGLYADTESLRSILRRNARVDLADGVAASKPNPDAGAQLSAPPAMPERRPKLLIESGPSFAAEPAPSAAGATSWVMPAIGVVVALACLGATVIAFILQSRRLKRAKLAASVIVPSPPTTLEDLVPVLLRISENAQAEAKAKKDRDEAVAEAKAIEEARRKQHAEFAAQLATMIEAMKAHPADPVPKS